MSMPIARLADEVFALLGDFSDDPELCALTCSDRARWESSASQRQIRKDGQMLYLQLEGRAECPLDCERAAELLDRIEFYVCECFWGRDDDRYPDVSFHIEFCTIRGNISGLRRALRKFLTELGDMDDLHVLRETLTFRDEYTVERIYDDGEYHKADILHRLPQKLALRVPNLPAYSHHMNSWSPVWERN